MKLFHPAFFFKLEQKSLIMVSCTGDFILEIHCLSDRWLWIIKITVDATD